MEGIDFAASTLELDVNMRQMRQMRQSRQRISRNFLILCASVTLTQYADAGKQETFTLLPSILLTAILSVVGSPSPFAYKKRTYIDWDTVKELSRTSFVSKKLLPDERENHSKPLSAEQGARKEYGSLDTVLGKSCLAFGRVLVVDGDQFDIDIPQLIEACYQCERSMRNVGHVTSAKDLYQNTKKVETFIKNVPPNFRGTMRPLLEYEKATGIHPYSDKMLLRDPSIALSLLWMRRHLAFQCELFRLLLTDSNMYKKSNLPNTVATTLQAYESVLEPYHGWTLQKISTAAIKLMTPPSMKQVLARLGGFNFTETSDESDNDLRSLDGCNHSLSISTTNEGDNFGEDFKVHRSGRIPGRNSETTKPKSNAKNAHKLVCQISIPADRKIPPVSLSFGIKEELATRRDMRGLIEILEPLLQHWTSIFLDLDLEDYRRV